MSEQSAANRIEGMNGVDFASESIGRSHIEYLAGEVIRTEGFMSNETLGMGQEYTHMFEVDHKNSLLVDIRSKTPLSDQPEKRTTTVTAADVYHVRGSYADEEATIAKVLSYTPFEYHKIHISKSENPRDVLDLLNAGINNHKNSLHKGGGR